MALKDKIREHTKAKGKKSGPPRARVAWGKSADLPQKLADLLDNGDLAEAVKVWRDGLKATKFVWDQTLQKFVDTGFPDWPIREKMAQMIAAYMEGRPVERQMQIRGTFQDLDAIREKLQYSPEAARLLNLPGVQEKGPEKQANVTRET